MRYELLLVGNLVLGIDIKMSKLVNELNYILDWLESMNPDPEEYTFDCYSQGLTKKQIDKDTSDLPFQLPQEIYDLYQWKNGMVDSGVYYRPVKFLFPNQSHNCNILKFLSLQDSVSNYFFLREFSREMADAVPDSDDEYWEREWLLVASFENKKILYILGDTNPSPVYLWDNIFGIQRVYQNFTSMISVIAECCESDIYKLVPHEYVGEVAYSFCVDEEKVDIEKTIYKIYNP